MLCTRCRKPIREKSFLKCPSCNRSYHKDCATFCLVPTCNARLRKFTKLEGTEKRVENNLDKSALHKFTKLERTEETKLENNLDKSAWFRKLVKIGIPIVLMFFITFIIKYQGTEKQNSNLYVPSEKLTKPGPEKEKTFTERKEDKSNKFGKMAGKVVSKETKEPLPGASVIIRGTTFGAATDASGNYVILNVPAGTYTVVASYVGYQNVTFSGVQVVAGLTRELNFELPSFKLLSTAIELRTFEVIAKRFYADGLSFLQSGDYEKALSYFKLAFKMNPLRADAYFGVGYCNGELSLWKDAIESYRQAIKIKTDYIKSNYNLGVVYLNNIEMDSALHQYEILRKFNSDLANNFYKVICIVSGQPGYHR